MFKAMADFYKLEKRIEHLKCGLIFVALLCIFTDVCVAFGFHLVAGIFSHLHLS